MTRLTPEQESLLLALGNAQHADGAPLILLRSWPNIIRHPALPDGGHLKDYEKLDLSMLVRAGLVTEPEEGKTAPPFAVTPEGFAYVDWLTAPEDVPAAPIGFAPPNRP